MIALYPGAFKPPHKGHFEVVKSLLNGSFFGTTYELSDFSEKGEDLLKGKGSKVEDRTNFTIRCGIIIQVVHTVLGCFYFIVGLNARE